MSCSGYEFFNLSQPSPLSHFPLKYFPCIHFKSLSDLVFIVFFIIHSVPHQPLFCGRFPLKLSFLRKGSFISVFLSLCPEFIYKAARDKPWTSTLMSLLNPKCLPVVPSRKHLSGVFRGKKMTHPNHWDCQPAVCSYPADLRVFKPGLCWSWEFLNNH